MVKFFSSLFLLTTTAIIVVCKGEHTVVVVKDETCHQIDGECMATEQQEDDVSSSSSSVIVMKGFLDAEACRKYREVHIDSRNSTSYQDVGGDTISSSMNFVGEVPVEEEHANKLLETFAKIENRERVMKLEEIPGYDIPDKSFKVKHTYLVKSSTLHQDYYKEGTTGVKNTIVKGNNAFIFLNTNPDATFQYGTLEPIPAEEGTLLIFKGDEWHNTMVNSGDVHLFGPLDTTNLFSVGGCPVALCSPTEAPKEEPKCGLFGLKCCKDTLLCCLFPKCYFCSSK